MSHPEFLVYFYFFLLPIVKKEKENRCLMEVAVFVGIIKLRLQRILEIEVHIKSMTYQRRKINDNEHILSNNDLFYI